MVPVTLAMRWTSSSHIDKRHSVDGETPISRVRLLWFNFQSCSEAFNSPNPKTSRPATSAINERPRQQCEPSWRVAVVTRSLTNGMGEPALKCG